MVDLSTARQQQVLASTPLLRQLPPATRLVLRGGPQVMAAAPDALSLPRSETPCRAVRNDIRAALWLGPDERLLLGSADAAAEMHGLLQRALAGVAHSLVDISHGQVGFEVSGARGPRAQHRLPPRPRSGILSHRHVHAHGIREGADRAVAHRRHDLPPRDGALLRPLCDRNPGARRPRELNFHGLRTLARGRKKPLQPLATLRGQPRSFRISAARCWDRRARAARPPPRAADSAPRSIP